MQQWRHHLKNTDRERMEPSDQRKGVAPPPLEKPIPEGAATIPLIPVEKLHPRAMTLAEAIARRRSRRAYTNEPLTLEELSFLLWATHGIREIHPERVHAFRTVPSGGCRHPHETYLRVRNVDGVPEGLWRHSAVEGVLVGVWERPPQGIPTLAEVCFDQAFVDQAAVSFIWTAIPYRTEWRYGDASLKDVLLTCGHICQNLYLACEAIGAGTCAIVAYHQEQLDAYLGVNGDDEISLYVAPVGRVARA